jgi:Uma2 family endonuclease
MAIIALTVRRESAPIRSDGPRRRNERVAVARVGLIQEREQSAMSTIAKRPRPGTAPREPRPAITDFGDQRIVIRGVDRDLYNRLDEAIDERQHIRLAYDGEDLELMTTSRLHEFYADLLGKFVSAVTFALDIDCVPAGETTWKTEEMDRGLQADRSYYFEPEKIRMSRRALKRKSMDPADYPSAPDLAIEIDASRPKVDRPAVYAALRAAEVWRFDGAEVTIEQLQLDGSYARAQTSRFLPVRAEEILRWILDDDATLTLVWERRLRQWARRLRRRR